MINERFDGLVRKVVPSTFLISLEIHGEFKLTQELMLPLKGTKIKF